MMKVTDPALLAQLNATAQPAAHASDTAAPASSLGEKVTDPSVLAQLNGTSSDAGNPVLQAAGKAAEYPIAAVQGIKLGALDSAQEVGTLAKNILSGTVGKLLPKSVDDAASKLGDIAAQKLADIKQGVASNEVVGSSNPVGQGTSLVEQHPVVSSIGQAAGNVAGQLALTGAPIGAATDVVAPAIKAIAPGLAGSPAAVGAATQATLGAGVGAATDPNNPLSGALKGAIAGGTLGAVGGNLGEAVKESGNIIHSTLEDLVASGQNPYNLKSLLTIQKNLADRGAIYREFETKQEALAATNDLMDTIRPNGYVPGTSPIKLIADKILTNAPEAEATNAANYAPINESTATVPLTNYKTMMDNVNTNFNKVPLPSKNLKETSINPDTGEVKVTTSPVAALPEAPTLNEALAYRKQLDSTITQAQMKAAHGEISNQDVLPYYQVRQALNQDIHAAADSIPYSDPANPDIKTLGDQLSKAETFNRTNVQPFKLIDKQGNIVDNPTAEAKIWTRISAELQARRPNFNNIRANAAMLGPNGKELVGWGMLENAVNKATNAAGEFTPSKVDEAITRMKATGLLAEVGTQGQNDVATGLSTIISAAAKAKPGAATQSFVGQKIAALTHSRAGIGILKRIGSPDINAQTTRDLLQKVSTVLGAQAAAKPEDQ